MTLFTRRQALLAAAALATGTRAQAQAMPAKPVRVIVGYSAGGAVDIIARARSPSTFRPVSASR